MFSSVKARLLLVSGFILFSAVAISSCVGDTCKNTADCRIGLMCHKNKCVEPTCSDGMIDGEEADVDCGGPKCAACDAGHHCTLSRDCESHICENGACMAISCNDGFKNGGETDIDCGGDCDTPCAVHKICGLDKDCESKHCVQGQCVDVTCTDKVKNGDEIDVDCGGSICAPCAAKAECTKPADCKSGVCTNGKCAEATCSDKVKNGDETDVDCGGKCGACELDKQCSKTTDCKSNICVDGLCVECEAPGQCPTLNVCAIGQCTKHKCGIDNLKAGTPVKSDNPCQTKSCNGKGGISTVNLNGDSYLASSDDNAKDCLVPTCVNGVAGTRIKAKGDACGDRGSQYCRGNNINSCDQCNESTQCPLQTGKFRECIDGTCKYTCNKVCTEYMCGTKFNSCTGEYEPCPANCSAVGVCNDYNECVPTTSTGGGTGGSTGGSTGGGTGGSTGGGDCKCPNGKACCDSVPKCPSNGKCS